MKLLTANTTYNVDQLAERLQMSRRKGKQKYAFEIMELARQISEA